MLGGAWALVHFFFPLVLFKARHFRVENSLPSPSPHFTYKESLDLNFPLAYKALHDLASHVPTTSLSSLTLPPVSSSPSLLPFFFLPLLSLSPTSGPLHCLLPLPLPQISQDSKSESMPQCHSIYSFCFIILHHICLSPYPPLECGPRRGRASCCTPNTPA